MAKTAAAKLVGASYIPKFPKLYAELRSLVTDAMGTRNSPIMRNWALSRLGGFIDSLRAMKADGVLPTEFLISFPEDLGTIKKIGDALSNPDERNRRQNDVAWRFYKLIRWDFSIESENRASA